MVRTTNYISEARAGLNEYSEIVWKILAAKLLIGKLEKTSSEMTMLKSQQSVAQSRYLDLDNQAREQEAAKAGLLAEAQNLPCTGYRGGT